METAQLVIDELTRIVERADAFRHGRDDFFMGIGLTEMHCIHWIGTIDHPNVTKIAGQMQMTRGAISKIAKKMTNKALITSYQVPPNNKIICYRLTEEGQKLFDAHLKIHTRIRDERLELLKSFSESEQGSILRFLNAVNRQLDLETAREVI